MNTFRMPSFFAFVFAAVVSAAAQVPNPTTNQNPAAQQPPLMNNGEPLYRIEVVARDIPAVNYFHRSGATRIGFEGTSLLPNAKGTAKVDAHAGRTSIALDLEGLTPANKFGLEYLTYVLWAVTPQGRPVNLGEILPTGKKNEVKMTFTTDLQAFGLIITAEPYYAVTMPSDLVVMQNVVEKKTSGIIETVNAHYNLLPRGAYEQTAGRHEVLHPITRDQRSPLELFEAMNAVQIAEAAGADQYAADSIATAKSALENAEKENKHKSNRKEVITYAREAVQSAEDARLITIRKIKAEDEAKQAEARRRAEEQKQQAEEAARQAQDAAAAAKARAEQQAAQRAQAEAAAQEAAAQAAQAKAARQAAEAQAQAAQQQAAAAAAQAQQMRKRLREQLNQVLQTRETARGLIVNMPDVLFAFNKYDLKPEAREKLAKVSGILLAYPDLKVQVEGYTDSIGSDAYNQKLSEERADSVRTYLTSQGVSGNNITAQGYGKSDPVASNATAAGRAQNRRVQLVVSGAAIGIQQSAPGAAGDANAPGMPGQPGTGAMKPAQNPPAPQPQR
jgi:outer membrane protein OmpA-like peptidoglycan-associated protein